jgi:HTH-type transcriptional regulator/antitoxin HigA
MHIPNGYKTPGQLLTKLIEERGWNQRVVAIILGVGESVINKIISGHRTVDAEMAVMFEAVFGIDADIFLELQKSYDLAKARIIAQPDPERATRAALFGGLPVADMIKRRWLEAEDIRDIQQVERSLVKFFGVHSINDIEILPHAAKKTRVATDATPSELAWIYRVQQIANEMMVGQCSEFSVRSALKKIEALLNAPDEIRKVPRILAECGIRYVIVEKIGSALIDGVCLWLDESSPVIGMALRFDRIDNFYFVLRHELEHVLRKHGRDAIILDTELEGERAGTGENIPEEERIANEAAANFGVTKQKLDRLISRKSPFFKETDLLGFARTVQVHPGIVVGRLQYATGRYDLFRHHLVKVRSKIAPSAMVDGWGDVAPVGF